MIMNDKMRTICSLHRNDNVSVPNELMNLLSAGLVSEGDCVFLRSLYSRRGNAVRESFPDEVGYECFVNHIHVDDYTTEVPLPVGLALVNELGAIWAQQGMGGTLRVILSSDDIDCVLRCHLLRQDQSWLADDIETYRNEAILVADFEMKQTSAGDACP